MNQHSTALNLENILGEVLELSELIVRQDPVPLIRSIPNTTSSRNQNASSNNLGECLNLVSRNRRKLDTQVVFGVQLPSL